jgi:hypothetical protein
MDAGTRESIACIRQRWANEKEQDRQRVEDAERMLRDRLRDALLCETRRFLPPCDCDEFLANALEDRAPRCRHYNGTGLFWWLAKQGF